ATGGPSSSGIETRNTPMNRRPRITPISPGSSPAAPGPLIGAHMSIAGGLDKAIGRALAVRARVLQIFTRNTHQWKARRRAPSVTVLLETVAGQGTTVGRSFEELPRIRDRVSAPGLVQFCADTCHIHAAGYDIVTERGYERTLQEFDDILGLTNLRAIHFNDSKTERGSRVDRHQHIGKGHLGARTFQRMLRDPRLRAIPKILELPKGKDGVVMDRRNLGLLRRLSEKALPRGRTSG